MNGAAEIASALGADRRQGDGYLCRCPLADEHSRGDATPSLSVSERDGRVLVHCQSRHAEEQGRVIDALKARGLWPNRSERRRVEGSARKPQAAGTERNDEKPKQEWRPILPVPASVKCGDLGKAIFHGKSPIAGWEYRSELDELLGFVLRYDQEDKAVPMTFCENVQGLRGWRFVGFPEPRPLYGLERLAANPSAVAIGVEGEKCASSLQGVIDAAEATGYVAVTWPGGAKATSKADWTPLVGRNVVVWPDHDKDGSDAAIKIARKLEAMQAARDGAIARDVQIVRPDPAWPVGHDVADLIDEGWDSERLLRYIEQNLIGVDALEQHTRERFPAEVQDTQERLIAELATLDPISYAQRKKVVAKELGVPGKAIDQAVKARKLEGPSSRENLAPPAPEPWPESVKASMVLDELHAYVKRFIFATEHALVAMVLWITYTYIFEIAETSPRLVLTSATKRCGKTRGLEVLGMLCLHALPGSNLSTNSVFRVIDLEHPTFILDEADTLGAHEKNELRGILNSGHTPANAWVIRNVPVGENAWEPKRFSTWCPIAMAAIGRLPDTWEDRSIRILMKRKSPDVKVERLGRRNVKAREEASQLCRKLARLAADHLETLRNAVPVIPDLGSDRSEDNWEHLLALGDLGGPRWAKSARAAALALSSGENANTLVDGEMLLADIRALFQERATDRLASGQICEHLATLENHPWPEYGRARKPISPTQLARLLADFEVKPRTVRLPDDSTPKGYVLSDFAEAFSSYPPIQPISPISSRHTATSVGRVGQSDDFQGATEGPCGGSENGTFPYGERGCGGVAADQPQNGRDDRISASDGDAARNREAIEEAEIDLLTAADADPEVF